MISVNRNWARQALATGLLFVLSQSCLAAVDIEKKITQHIDKSLADSASLLEKTVNINSGTMNFDGVKKVGALYQAEFDAMGFETQWVDGEEFNRAGHLVASFGSTGPKILMIGHLDTVFAKDDAFQNYKRIDDNHVAGPGITDMKGGDVIIIAALKALKELDLLDKVSVKVVMTGDEESSGSPLSLSKKALIDAAIWADIALGFEDADGDIKTAVVARRGSIGWQLDVTGKPAHSSQIFTDTIGYGAIFEVARILNTFREELAGVGNITFNPGLIAGGTEVTVQPENSIVQGFGKTNVVAKEVTVKGGIRTLTPEELTKAKNLMQDIATRSLPHTSATLTFEEGYPPMAPTEQNYALLKMYSDVSESLGYGPVEPVNPRNAGAADISFAADHVDMAIDGLGLMGEGGHTKDEIADMTSFAQNIHKAAVLIYRLGENWASMGE
ncbi:M20/M25/M40 family metallo-hydrolase [Alteromonas hispanica]|uniref:M20/M25/M40 family metallo-hydrolase n=1 Tax=Alteromonas hispanica TaxID=315421 RepID=A0A6L9MSA1_9ALTE|nr:M20/M25/M40 family metallo-hydrolase [Alteromonas hispanica]NDW20853.1 M20/M25/M40 family metallo-hydrolase [Alteromonas hispanica]